jgi:flagellar hook protein FlgE
MIDGMRNDGLSTAMYKGVQGMQSASMQMHAASSQLAQSNKQNVDMNGAVVSLMSSSVQTQASAEVINRADGMIGTIIDIFV